MADIRNDMEGGLTNFINEQKAFPGEATLSLYQFDDQFETVINHVNLKNLSPDVKLVPRGMTALYDSLKLAIDNTGEYLSSLNESERPEKVLFMTVTDGFENASIHTTSEKLKQLIEQQTVIYKWAFVFLGANQDAILNAASIGINIATNFDPNAKSVNAVFAAASYNTSLYRSTGDMKYDTNY